MRTLVVSIAVLLALAAGTAFAAPSPYEIQLLTGSFTPAPGSRSAGLEQVQAAAARGEKVHVLLQLEDIPADAQDLVRAGIDLGPYATGRAWIASVPAETLTAIAARPAGSRVTILDSTALADHSTHVAGTVGGDGAPTSADAQKTVDILRAGNGTLGDAATAWLDDNDDNGNDYVGYYSGNHATAANRPQLVIVYQ